LSKKIASNEHKTFRHGKDSDSSFFSCPCLVPTAERFSLLFVVCPFLSFLFRHALFLRPIPAPAYALVDFNPYPLRENVLSFRGQNPLVEHFAHHSPQITVFKVAACCLPKFF